MTIIIKSFPFINGNFININFKIKNIFGTSYQTNYDRNRRIRHKMRVHDNNQSNRE